MGSRSSRLDSGERVELPVHTIPTTRSARRAGEYRHFMQKEIYEQARSVTDTIRGRADLAARRGAASTICT